MQFKESRFELPYAYATRQGYAGVGPGNFFRYFRTHAEAEKSIRWMKRRKQWHGSIEYRPGECFSLGAFTF